MPNVAARLMLFACLLGAASGAMLYYARQIEPTFSVTSGVFLRILASVTCLALPLVYRRDLPRIHSWKNGSHLWLWGIFGALTVDTYYSSVTLVGAGLANALNAGGGAVLIALAPLLTREVSPRSHIWAAIGCTLGMFLLCQSGIHHLNQPLGLLLAAVSGIFSGLAYLMIARSGLKHSPETVLLHWTAINLIAVAALMLSSTVVWPVKAVTWYVLMASALLMAWSQYFTARAYQTGHASLVACLAFCGPLFSLIIDFWIFELVLTNTVLLGVALIFVCGLVIPLRGR